MIAEMERAIYKRDNIEAKGKGGRKRGGAQLCLCLGSGEVALATGLAIGLVQALTSIQEMTLTFVPKLAAIGATFWLAMEFMSAAFLDLWRDNLIPLIASGAA